MHKGNTSLTDLQLAILLKEKRGKVKERYVLRKKPRRVEGGGRPGAVNDEVKN